MCKRRKLIGAWHRASGYIQKEIGTYWKEENKYYDNRDQATHYTCSWDQANGMHETDCRLKSYKTEQPVQIQQIQTSNGL